MRVGDLSVRLSLNVAEFQKGLTAARISMQRLSQQAQELEPAMGAIGAAIKTVGAIMAAGFGAAVVGSVKGAVALENYRNTLNVVMKDQQKAAAMMAWAVDFANRTPFETDSIIQATVRLQAYGLEAQKVLPAIGDMAGVMNKDIMQAVEAVADAQTGELERLKEFGITKAMIIQKNAEMGRNIEIVNNMGQITDQKAFNEALFTLMNDRFKGGMEIQAKSFSGLWSTVVGVFKTSLATMAGISATGEVQIGGLFDNLKKKMQLVIDKLADWQKNGQLQAWSDRVSQAFSKMWAVAEKIIAGLVAAAKWIAKHWAVIEPIVAGVVAGFLTFKAATLVIGTVSAAMAVLNAVMAANPIALVVLAIGALVAAGVALYKNWDKVRYYCLQAWGAIKVYVLKAIDAVLKGYEKLLGWVPVLGEKIKKAREGIGNLITKEQGTMAVRSLEYQADQMEKAAEKIKKAQEKAYQPSLGVTVPEMPVVQTAEKAKKAAKDTRAAWERTADILSTKLQILQARQEIAGIAAERHGDKTKALGEKITWLNKELDVQKQIVAAVNDAYQQSVRAKGANAEETLKLALRLDQEKKAQADIEKQIYDTSKAIKDQAKELRDLSDEVTAVEKKYREDMAAALEDYQKKVAETNAKLAEDERRLTEEFERSIDQRASALANFVGLFDKVTSKEVSGAELLENLRGQVQTFEEWSANIQALAARGVDEGLIAELREMGPKAAPEIAALNTLTDAELQEYVVLWRTKNQEARAEAISQLQQQKVEMQQKLMEIRAAAQEQLELYRAEWEKKNAEIRKNAEEEMKRIEQRFESIAKAGTTYGVSLVTNFIGGIESQMDQLRDVMESMAAMVDSYMPHSPAKRGPLSRIMEWGPALVKGLAEGIRVSLPNLGDISARMAMLSPAALAPAMANSYSTSNVANYGGNTFQIYIQGGSPSDQADALLRELARRGIKL